jgi:hypothetical protein
MVQFGQRPSVGMGQWGCLKKMLVVDDFSRNPVSCITIPLRRTTHTFGASCARAWRVTGPFE